LHHGTTSAYRSNGAEILEWQLASLSESARHKSSQLCVELEPGIYSS
jgi:hypothetical protein